jgi:ribosomal protein S18 acetylase RimI-like enzyme
MPPAPPSPPTVRPARPDDAEALVEFNFRMARETEDLTLDRAVLSQGVRAALTDANKALYFVAEIDGAPAGALMITHEWSDWRNGDLWWVQSVYVLPDYRKAGVFKALYRHVQRAAREAGAAGLRLYVEKENAVAQQVYARLGMAMTHYAVMEEIF